MTEDLFGGKPMTQQEKTAASRKRTSDLTLRVIKYLNDSGCFVVHRSNNIASPIIKREKKQFNAFDENGKPVIFEYIEVKTMFKKGNIKKKILDISGFTTSIDRSEATKGKHIELEIKTGSDRMDDEQIERINEINKAGGISFAFSSWENFLIQIAPHMPNRIPF